MRYTRSPFPRLANFRDCSHQKDAIDFIRRRETGDIPLHLKLWREHTSETDQVLYARDNWKEPVK